MAYVQHVHITVVEAHNIFLESALFALCIIEESSRLHTDFAGFVAWLLDGSVRCTRFVLVYVVVVRIGTTHQGGVRIVH